MYNNEFKNKMFIFNKMIECGLDFNQNILEISADATGEKYTSLLEMFSSNSHNNYLFSKKYK